MSQRRRRLILASLILLGFVTAACGDAPGAPEIVLQSGEALPGFDLHFLNHETDWRLTSDPVRIRVSDTEVREIAHADLLGIEVLDIERDENDLVDRLQVVYTTADEQITGWSYPLGDFSLQLHVSPARDLSDSELKRSFVAETGAHLEYEVRQIEGRQHLRIPLAQIRSITFPNGAVGDGLGASR